MKNNGRNGMRLWTKFTISHSIILMFLIIISIVSVVKLRAVYELSNVIVNDRYLKTEILNDIDNNLDKIVISTQRLAIPEDGGLVKKEINSIDALRQNSLEKKGELDYIIRSTEGKSLLGDISDTQRAYFSRLDEYFAMISSSTSSHDLIGSASARKFLSGELALSGGKYHNSLQALIDFQARRMHETVRESETKYKATNVFILLVTILSIIAGTVFSMLIVSSVIKQLGGEPMDIIKTINGVAEGRLSIGEDMPTEQKIGVFKALATMIGKLKEREVLLSSKLELEKQLEQQVHQLMQRDVIQDTIKNILEISLEQIPLMGKLERIIDIVVSVPNIGLGNKGCIFLTSENPGELVMVAQRRLHESLLVQCARLPFGKCLCGLAASTHNIVFSNKVDTLHEHRYDGMSEHGHYCIPIKSGNEILGVLCLYIEAGYERKRQHEEFFVAVANSIAGIIEHGKTEDAIRKSNVFINTVLNSMNDSIAVIDVKDFTIVNANNNFIKEYGGVNGLPEREIIGNNCYKVTHKFTEPCSQRDYSCPIMHTLRTGEHARSEHLHHDKEGKKLYVSCTSSPIKDEKGNIVQCVYVLRNISQRKHYEEQLKLLAHYDNVTSLPNRILFLDRLNTAINMAERDNYMVALLYIDLDGFKAVNDNFGHHIGDLLLKAVSERMLSIVRKTDTVARIGGDEFIVILNKISQREDASAIAGKIIESLNKPFMIDEKQCSVGASIGIEVYPFTTAETEVGNLNDLIIKRADSAMYKVKESGKNNFRFYDGENAEI